MLSYPDVYYLEDVDVGGDMIGSTFSCQGLEAGFVVEIGLCLLDVGPGDDVDGVKCC
jgi:hypothetical protein